VSESLKEKRERARAVQAPGTAAAPGEWEAVIPLDDPADAAPPFPLDAFPAVVADHVHAVAESVYCPVDYPAVATLAAASAAIGGAFVAKIKASFFQGAGLYCAIVGDPSAKKSPPIKHVLRPIQTEQSARMEALREKYGDRGDGKLPDLYKHGEGELFVSDVTVEKLGEMLRQQPRGLLLYKPELVGWLLGQNQYKAKGTGSDRSFFLEVYDSEPITIHRKNMLGGAVYVSRPSLTMVGATQPEVVREFFARKDGLSERILWSYPTPLPARGERWYETPQELSDRWAAVLNCLWTIPMRHPEDGQTRPRGRMLPLSRTDGREAWQEFTDQLAATMVDPDFPAWMKSAYGKFEGTCARLAMILQLLDGAAGGSSMCTDELRGPWIRAAARMCFYFGSHALRVQQACGADPRLEGAKRILLWIKEGEARSEFTRSELWQSLRRNPLFRRPEDLSAPLVALISRNAIRAKRQGGEAGAGRPATAAYEVNPALAREPQRGE
jgi:hypothetical protein